MDGYAEPSAVSISWVRNSIARSAARWSSAGERVAIRMAATTAERGTEARAGAALIVHGKKARDSTKGESWATVQCASCSVAPAPSTKLKVVRAGAGGAGAGGAAAMSFALESVREGRQPAKKALADEG